MREILFRAKRIDDGEWVEGFLLSTNEHTYIAYTNQFDDDLFLSPKEIFIEVDPKTVCQYTGLTDKNGRKIFEGDILKLPAWITNHGEYAVCEYIDSKNEVVEIIGFALFDVNKKLINSDEWGEFEVNGNIFDNPDLLKE